jgi:hypothetical protein
MTPAEKSRRRSIRLHVIDGGLFLVAAFLAFAALFKLTRACLRLLA